MILQKQVCTIEQGNTLKELGIDQTCSLAIHYEHPNMGQITIYRVGELSGREVAAFSVPELMVMLPELEEVHRLDGLGGYWYCGTLCISDDFEDNGETMAQVIANRLINLIKRGIVTVEDCNKRLLAA